MYILHTIPSLDQNDGGPSRSVTSLAINQALQNNVLICTRLTSNPYTKKIQDSHLNIRFVESIHFKYGLHKIILQTKPDLIHGHGIWQMPVHSMAQISRKIKTPYIISPRGMLEPWALKQGIIKKKIALFLYQAKDLSEAACIHCTSEMEAENIRKLGFKNHIAVIPNGLDLSEYFVPEKKTSGKNKTILFLSRIHPKKGLEVFIKAWSIIDENSKRGWKVNIVGNGNNNYIALLKKRINAYELTEQIDILGPQFGEDKLSSYRNAEIFILPSYSENFGIVVAEALACGLPVITTTGTPWKELLDHNAGWYINLQTETLVDTLKKALHLSDEERKLMGMNGRKLIEDNYSIDSIAQKMGKLYNWVLKKGEKPEFMYN